MISREMVIGGFWALIVLLLAYFSFEMLILAAQPFKWVSNFLG